MSRTRRRRVVAWVCAVAGAFVLGALLMWVLMSGNRVLLSGSSGGATGHGESPYEITGDLAEPVSPGILVPLELSFANTHDKPMDVSDLIIVVESVDAPHASATRPCGPEDFVVQQLDPGVMMRLETGQIGSFTQLGIPREDWPRVGMLDAGENQDGCKSATLTLAYTATGRFGS